jgi:hypothetical protein
MKMVVTFSNRGNNFFLRWRNFKSGSPVEI